MIDLCVSSSILSFVLCAKVRKLLDIRLQQAEKLLRLVIINRFFLLFSFIFAYFAFKFYFSMNRHLIIYIAILLFCLPLKAQRSVLRKLSPTVKHLVLQQTINSDEPQKAKSFGKEQSLCAFVKLTDSSVLDEYNIRDLADFGDIHIVSLPVKSISSFASDSRVLRIEAGKGTTTQMDELPSQINTLPVYLGQNLPQAFTGKGVIVGVQDIGFDLTHPNFYSSDLSEYRIKALWDQLSTDTIGSELVVGQEYIGQEAILNYAHSRDGLTQGHGTHTLGIAAGSGYDSPYRGMAWESDICLVSNAVSADVEYIAEEDLEKYTYAVDALGFKYIFDYAESVGKPCVINFSEGSRQDLYGDDLLYYEILNRLVGPGRIIVASAGNNNLEPSYIHKPKGKPSAGTFLEKWGNYLYYLTSGSGHYNTRIVFHDEENDTINISSEWLCQQPDSLVYDTLQVSGKQYVLGIGAYPSCYDENRLVIEHYLVGPDRIGMYTPSISAEILGSDVDVEMYKLVGNFVTKPADPKLADAVCTHDINSPSSSPDVISVGATSYRTKFTNVYGETVEIDASGIGDRSLYSSVGPTFDGRIKPDVVAPGNAIISSYSSYYFEANPDAVDKEVIISTFDHQNRTYPWVAETGTSMSSPAVAGAIALWLQAKPDLTKDEIMDIFAHTCTHPKDEMDYPNNEYGYGQIDVYQGLLYLLNFSSIQQITPHQPSKVSFSLKEGNLHIEFTEPLKKKANISIYTTAGVLLQNLQLAENEQVTTIPLPPSTKGIIAVQVNGDSPSTTGSTLLRVKP